MKKITLLAASAVMVFAMCGQKKADVDRSSILVKKAFRDDNTYVIVCRGFPREGVEGIQAGETAKEAALLNAQMIARESFNESVDVVALGTVEKYELKADHAVVEYVIKAPGLKRSLKRE